MRYISYYLCLRLVWNQPILSNKRHGSENLCPLAGLRIDRKPPVHQVNPLLHTQQSQTSVCPRLFRIEPGTAIGHDKLNLILDPSQFHCELADAAVVYGVLKSFLCDPKRHREISFDIFLGTFLSMNSTLTSC